MGTPAERVDDVVAAHADLGLPRLYFAKEAPRHDVFVPAFLIAAVPVTNAAWSSFVRSTGRPFGHPTMADHPADGVSWEEAVAFCAWLTHATGDRIELPSEEQWERAARGDDDREYPWGDTYDRACANLAENGVGSTTPVGSHPRGASPFGVLDLAGNVDEWTRTPYAPYAGAPRDVPAVESWAADPHVTRGGRWSHHRDLARCARRHGVYPPAHGAGFRLVRAVAHPV